MEVYSNGVYNARIFLFGNFFLTEKNYYGKFLNGLVLLLKIYLN